MRFLRTLFALAALLLPSAVLAQPVTVIGAVTPGHCVNFFSTTQLQDAGAACGSGGGGVSSVTNSDGTLTFSPTTGAVVGSLALAHANTWSALQTFSAAISASTITDSALASAGTQCVQASSTGVLSGTGGACGSGSGAVNSVTNSDGTLTFSPTTGAVVGSLALAHANTWTVLQTFSAGISAATPVTFSSITGSTQCLQVSSTGVLSGFGGGCGTLTGTLSATQGGTGIASPAAHSLLVAEGSSAFNLITAATAGRIVVDQGTGIDWSAVAMSGDCSLASSGAITCTKTNGTAFGTFATANAATPPAIGGTTPAAGAFTTLSATGNFTSNITGGGTQCVQASNTGVLSGVGAACNVITSVSNADGTLTISPTTGAVVASIALGHANTWTAKQTISGAGFALTGNISAASWTTNGIKFANVPGTVTDTTSTGTVAAEYTSVFGGDTVAANSATTFTNYYQEYIKAPVAGTNVTMTAKWALGVDSLQVNGVATITGNLTTNLTSAGTQCVQASSTGVLSGTGSACGSGSGAVTSVTNADGTLTISPTTGAVVASLNLGNANTWTAVQTFTNSDIKLLGSSTGATTFTSANAGASNFTATVPANTGTLAELNLAQTWTAVQTFNSSDLVTAGATSGNLTIICTATCGSSTATFPANTGTVAELNLAQTWSAVQTFNSSDLKLAGATSGALTINCAATCGANTLTLPAGTTDFSATGGAGQYVKQSSSGGALTVGTIPAGDITAGGSNTQVQYNSSNAFAGSAGFTFDGTSKITLGVAGTSVGGVALANATSGTITLNPATGALGSVTATLPANTGTIAETNLAQTFSANQTFSAQLIETGTTAPASAGGNTVVLGTVTAPTLTATGQAFLFNTVAGGAILQGDGSTSDITIANKSGSAVCTVATGTTTLNCATLTLTNPLALTSGGTNASLTASNGGIVYSTASAFAVLAGTVTAGQCLLSGSSAAPTWGSCSGASAVSSVTNADGTLTISPTTGAVVASLNLGNANTWTGAQTFNATVNHTAAFQQNGVNEVPQPEGRLTLQSGTPVMTANQTAKSQVFYDCYRGGNAVPVYNGTYDVLLAIASCEISMTMATTGTGVTNSGGVFDVFGVNVSGALAICVATNGSGGGWASDTTGSNTARGTGYSALDFSTRSYITNKNSITNCYTGATQRGPISANQGTYLGTLFTTAAGQTAMNFQPAAAAGGNNSTLGLYNAYNAVLVTVTSRDSTASWSYGTNTWRAADGNANNSFRYVDGLATVYVSAFYNCNVNPASAANAGIGINFDSTSAAPSPSAATAISTNSNSNDLTTAASFLPAIGLHTINAVENTNAQSVTFAGSSAGTGMSQAQGLVGWLTM